MSRKRRNHFIPRMLQKHFASRIVGEKVFIWRYERGNQSREFSTKDVGLGRDFYGEDDDVLENKFTELEGTHSSVLTDIVAGTFDFSRRASVLADFIWLLAMRTEANRTMLGQTFDAMLGEMAQQSSSEAVSQALLVKGDETFDENLREIFATLPDDQKAQFLQPDKFAQIMKIKDDFKQLVHSGDAAQLFAGMLGHVRAEVVKKSTVKNSHIKGLMQLIDKGARCPRNKEPHLWSVLTSDTPSFVLGVECR